MVTTRLTGEEIEELQALGSAHFWPHSRPAGDMSDETGIKLVTGGEGIWVEGADGNRYVQQAEEKKYVLNVPRLSLEPKLNTPLHITPDIRLRGPAAD